MKSHAGLYYNVFVQFLFIRKGALGFALISLIASGEVSLAYARLARVAVPVADLRAQALPASPTYEHDPLEESQLLYGEEVEVAEEKEGWARVFAVEQREWSHDQQWEGYPGWVELHSLCSYSLDWTPNLHVTSKLGFIRSAPAVTSPVKMTLSLGSRIFGAEQAIPKGAQESWWRLKLLDGTTGWIRAEEVTPIALLEELRSNPAAIRRRLIETARLFLGDPYYWGGRSARDPQAPAPPHWGCDCSGLIGLVYRASSYQIPRDAHEIWMQARPIAREELSPGDLVFLSHPQDPNRISHIMFYSGDGKVIEAPGTGFPVREIPLDERLKGNDRRNVFYGTYLPQE